MSIDLSDADFRPMETFAFQHWNERSGPPYADLRPLSDDAAERVWRRAAQLSAQPWADGVTALTPQVLIPERLDLRTLEAWTKQTVTEWLRGRGVGDGDDVIICYQPRVALCVRWGVLCDHWLVLLWTGACVWPASEAWILLHDGDQFAFGVRG